MKKIVSILVLIVSSWSTNAQYHPLLNNSAWVVHIYPFIGPDPYYDIIYEEDDVIIGSYTYKKIHDPVYNQDLYFREDINTQKVYQYVDGEDNIVFDFSLQVSDVITFENGITYTVTSVSNINVADGTRKAISLNSVLGSEYWIEGVGSSSHPLISHIVWSEPTVILSCSYQDSLNIYSSLNSNCESILRTIENNSPFSEIKVVPNPFSNRATLTLNQKLENGTLRISNFLGELVKEIKSVKGNEINIERGDLKNGIYFVQVFENNILVKTKKVIISN